MVIYFDNVVLHQIKSENPIKRNFTILLFISVVVLITLSVIQYYLVNNTYQLTKEKYYAEVKKEIGKITASKEMEALNDSSKEVLKLVAHQYVKEHLSKPDFFKRLRAMNNAAIGNGNLQLMDLIRKSPLLRGVRYKSQYDEIVLETNGHADTLLIASQPPFLHLGSPFNTNNTLKLSTGNTYSSDNEHDKSNGRVKTHERFKLHFLQSQYLDVSVWKDEVLKRMYGVFLLATALIIGVSMVLFFIFRAMLRQKKLADIKTDFANNITHELKTPLSSVSIIFKSINRPEVKQDPQMLSEMLLSLERQFVKIQHTVDNVLDSAMAADMRIEMERVDIAAFLTTYSNNQAFGTHQLVTNILPEKVIIRTNLVLLEKVLDNLLQNAIKYTKPGSVISLTSGVDAHWYSIAVSDNGPGISKEHQRLVFNKFYRVPEQNRHTVKGLGLGLYLVKQVMENLQGSINLESTIDGGSTFTIKLPLHES